MLNWPTLDKNSSEDIASLPLDLVWECLRGVRDLGTGSSQAIRVSASLVPLCLPTDLRNDPEHGAVLWHKEQLRLLSRESWGGEGGSRADGARGDPKCHQVTRRHFNKRQRKLCI